MIRHPLASVSRSRTWGSLFSALSLVLLLTLSGCATPKSMVVLLPEEGKPSGEVTVENARGTQVLDQSWESVEIAGKHAAPGKPVILEESEVKKAFGSARAAMPAPPVHFVLYFKLDSTELVPESRELLPEIVKVIRARQPAMVSVVGHTDTVGSESYNYVLGLRRATSVFQKLTTLGAVTVGVESLSRGKSEPKVKTADQVLEPKNRRVEVTVR